MPVTEIEPRPSEGTPLYVHLPFCAAKCHYCDFFSVPDEGQDVDGTLAAISAEVERRAPARPRTVFLGGGTPSLLSIPQLRRFLDHLDAVTGFRDSSEEVTAECNPESLDTDKARALLDLGVDRLSIGFQALDQAALELFGRVHEVEDSFRAYEAARAAGATSVNVDLIYAWPGQTLEGWRRDLARVLDLGPEHLAAYNLTFEEGTRFTRWLEDGRMKKAPEELELALFEALREGLVGRDIRPYEISNYSLKGHECAHNRNYWANGPYVGVGPSAVSFTGGRRAGNPRGIVTYLRAVERGGSPAAWEERLEPLARLGETWWLGLRRVEGVDPAEARQTAGLEARLEAGLEAGDGAGLAAEGEADPCLAEARRLAAEGVLEERGGRFALTARGLPLADWVARKFLSPG